MPVTPSPLKIVRRAAMKRLPKKRELVNRRPPKVHPFRNKLKPLPTLVAGVVKVSGHPPPRVLPRVNPRLVLPKPVRVRLRPVGFTPQVRRQPARQDRLGRAQKQVRVQVPRLPVAERKVKKVLQPHMRHNKKKQPVPQRQVHLHKRRLLRVRQPWLKHVPKLQKPQKLQPHLKLNPRQKPPPPPQKVKQVKRDKRKHPRVKRRHKPFMLQQPQLLLMRQLRQLLVGKHKRLLNRPQRVRLLPALQVRRRVLPPHRPPRRAQPMLPPLRDKKVHMPQPPALQHPLLIPQQLVQP